MSSPIEEIHFETAPDFLDYLQPRRPHWFPTDASDPEWVFRGHADSRWRLIPSAMRTDWFDRFKDRERDRICSIVDKYPISWTEGTLPSRERLVEFLLQQAAERAAVSEFIDLADQAGNHIPDNEIVRWDTAVFSFEQLEENYKSLVQNHSSTHGQK